MIQSTGIARELARQRELTITRELARPRVRAPLVVEFLPTATLVAGVLAILAISPA